MSTQQRRQQRNAQGRTFCVKASFNIMIMFTHHGLALQVESAVQLLTIILVEGHLLASLHLARLLEADKPLPQIRQTFFYGCFSAVTHSTGSQAQQLNRRTDPDLTDTYDLYCQHLPQGHASNKCRRCQ